MIGHTVEHPRDVISFRRLLFSVHHTWDKQNLALLYKALVCPLLEYGNLAWSPYLKGDIEKLRAVQHRAQQKLYSRSKNYLIKKG